MKLSKKYELWINNSQANWFWKLDKQINTYLKVVEIFSNIQNLNDFVHFRRNYPPEWIYIPAIRLDDKYLWKSMFWWIYLYHEKYDKSFLNRMEKMQINNQKMFLEYMEDIYSRILQWWLEFDPEFDMSIIFSKEDTLYVIKNYCSNEAVQKCNAKLDIHPTERRWTINKVLFYRATNENKFTEKMFDDYTEWRNSKRVAYDFINYLFNKNILK